MTDIAFHFGAPDKIAYICRLLRKAVRLGSRVFVVVDRSDLSRLDQDLWAVSPTDFVSHCCDDADVKLLQRSYVVLGVSSAAHYADRPLLVNLSNSIPADFDRYAKLIEVVSMDEDDRAQARLRWKQYISLGYNIMKHDLQLKGMH